MPNKKNKNNKFKLGKLNLKKGLATVLASTLGISSGAALVALNSEKNITSAAGLRYYNDTDINNQTAKMMDGVNNLTAGCYMNAEITPPAAAGGEYSANLKFTIPNVDSSNLKIFVMDRNPSSDFGVKEYQITSGYLNPTPSAYVPNLDKSVYDVHVYNGTLAEENFVCKASFAVVAGIGTPTEKTILDGSGAATDKVALVYTGPTGLGTNQCAIAFPESAVPFSATTAKVVLFPTNRDGSAVNIDQSLYDYSVSRQYTLASGKQETYMLYFPIAYAGTEAGTTYEAHFYIDEVKSGNFIGKITGLTLS